MRLVLLAAALLLTGAACLAQAEGDGRVLAEIDGLRLRAAPSTQAEVLALLPPAAPLWFVGRTADAGWLYIRNESGALGWVFAEYVQTGADVLALPRADEGPLFAPRAALSDDEAATVRRIFEAGQARGQRAGVFAKIGDSITAAPHTLAPFALGPYRLGDFQHLQRVIDHFNQTPLGDGVTSFNRVSLAAVNGWSTDAVLDPAFADPAACLTGESPLACEYRATRPAFALILFGTNDVAHLDEDTYAVNLNQIIDFSMEQGIIPLVSTIPVRVGYEAQVAAFNARVVRLARRHALPLWDFGAALAGLPGQGLAPDGAHPSMPPAGLRGAGDFRAGNLDSGFVVRNLTALQLLAAVLDELRA